MNLRNELKQKIILYRENSEDGDQGGWVYDIAVRDGHGFSPPETEYAELTQGFRNGGIAALDPGKQLSDRVNISKLFILTTPGKYTITVRRLDAHNRIFVFSNTVRVRVVP